MKIKQLAAVLLAMCMTAALLPATAFAVTSNTIYAVSYGHGVVSADTDSAAAGTVVTVTLEPDASRLHMGQGSTAIDPEPYVMQQQMEADMKYVLASPTGTVADVNSALPATSAYTAGTTVDSDDYSGAAAYYPTNFVFAITNDANATEISLAKINDTTYTFTMPYAAVKVVAGFGSVATEPAGARDPITGSAINRIQMGNPGNRNSYLDYAVEMRTDLKCLYYPSYLENVFDFTDEQTLHVTYPAEGANTYGSFLLSVLGVARDYSGTKQISLSETSFVLPSSISAADAQRKMFSVTGDGSGNFTVSCLLTSGFVVTTPYCTAINSHEIKSKQVYSYIYSPNATFEDQSNPGVASITGGYYYTDRLMTVSAYKTGVSFAFKYGSSIPDEVWLGDMDLVDGDNTTYWVNNTATGSVKSDGASASNFNAKYEPATRTLTINGLDVEGSFYNVALDANCDLNIVVNGTNKIINTYSAQGNSSFGILVRGQLHFSGSGTLTTKAGDGAGSTSIGIYSSYSISVALSGGTINVYGRGAVDTSCGILSAPSNPQGVSNLTVTSGTLNVYGGNTTANASASMGMYIDNELIISGGTITATGGTVTGTSGKSYGVSAGTAEISSAFTATGGTATGTSGASYGITVGTAEISSAFTATGGAAQESTGIKIYQLLIKDGALATVIGGSGDDSTGIFAVAKSETELGVIIITGGEVITKSDSSARIHVAFNIQPVFFDAAQTSANWCMWRLSNSGAYTSNVNTPYTLAAGNTHVELKADTNVTAVTLSTNAPVVNTEITTTLAPRGATASYQWYTNTTSSATGGTVISGATAASYTPQASDLGKYLYVVATGTGSFTGSAKAVTTGKITATPPSFIPVTDIAMTNASSVRVNTDLTLVGTVTPADASNKTIVWSLDDAETTGASVTNGVFKATTAGTAALKATVIDGTAQGTDYSETFNITVTVAQDPSLIAYRIDKGANGKWTNGSGLGLSFISNGEFSKFTGVKVNGKLISDSNYTAVLGSTVVTLKPAYLSALSAGTYNLTIVFSDGEASTQFTIEAKAADVTSPQTGDSSNMLLWVCLLFVSGAGVLAAVIYTKKKNHSAE